MAIRVATDALIGKALNYAVAVAQGYSGWDGVRFTRYRGGEEGAYALGDLRFSEDWALAGPIIDVENIEWRSFSVVAASIWRRDGVEPAELLAKSLGRTKLEAAMRCYVRYRLGAFVEVPEGVEYA